MRKTQKEFITVTASIFGFAVAVGCSSYNEHRVTEWTTPNRPSIVQTREGYDTYGRRWGGARFVPITDVAPKATPHAATEINTGIVTLDKRVPQAVALGEEYPVDLKVTALEQAGFVTVNDMIPDGAEYLKSDPEASRDGSLLTWKFASMEKDEVKNIRSYYKASKEGQLSSCCTVAAMPRTCASTFVGKPMLTISKTGPETALLGADITYTTTVSNPGTMPAHNVVVTDKIPDGLSHSSGKYEIAFNVGDLAPNESKSFPVVLKAVQRGSVCNSAVAVAANIPEIGAQACTLIQQPGLALLKTGDPEQFLNRRASYQIVVTNTGDTTLKDVAVVDTASEPTTFVAADGAVVDRQTATWLISELAPGQAKTFKTTLTSKVAGTYRNQVAATAGAMREVAEVNTLWKGLSALAIEVIDDVDPVQVGETTTYTIRVTNQGTADATNIGLRALFTDHVKPVSAEGLTVGEGQEMSVSSIPKLAPKQSATYKITVQGKQPGDARLKVTLTSDELSSPVIEEESTRIY